MEYLEFLIRSTQQVILWDELNIEIQGFGSGVIIEYNQNQYFLTVAHVTDYEKMNAALETGIESNGGTFLYNLGAMQYFDLYQVKEEILSGGELEISEFEDILKKDSLEKIDFSITEFSPKEHDFKLNQNKVDLGEFGVIEGGSKIFLKISDFDYKPKTDNRYCFFGTIRHSLNETDKKLVRKGKLELDMSYYGEHNGFYVFKLQSTILDKFDYKGTSGAPVYDDEGQFVGLVSYYNEVYPDYLFVISNPLIKRYLDIYIQIGKDEK